MGAQGKPPRPLLRGGPGAHVSAAARPASRGGTGGSGRAAAQVPRPRPPAGPAAVGASRRVAECGPALATPVSSVVRRRVGDSGHWGARPRSLRASGGRPLALFAGVHPKLSRGPGRRVAGGPPWRARHRAPPSRRVPPRGRGEAIAPAWRRIWPRVLPRPLGPGGRGGAGTTNQPSGRDSRVSRSRSRTFRCLSWWLRPSISSCATPRKKRRCFSSSPSLASSSCRHSR